MLIPTLAGWVAGESVTAAKLTTHTKTAIENGVYFKPFCSITNTATQNIPSQSSPATRLVYNSIVEDSDSMADLVNNRMVVKTAGRWRITAQVLFASNATSYRYGSILGGPAATPVNKAVETVPAASGTNTRFQVTWTGRLSVNDIIAVEVAQVSGSALATEVGFGGCFLQAEWISL